MTEIGPDSTYETNSNSKAKINFEKDVYPISSNVSSDEFPRSESTNFMRTKTNSTV